ncbi:LysR family transcriptional regulator [Paenibacillus sp. N3/727]|uniref:LysR family transcriptional regulator n=1 Tax=Paenibacillus sp. N3/727 TaxID=2925845 RepID=UPI001F5395DE|nr:LysR family transcriptional regulator [Paenibacillus sp. N3/727]UNK19319.1 LysR family transcriptional regulator [Paenibacillus sp. N3/727]
MNLEQMEYIVQVAKTGSLTSAAQQSHVTLSAISQSISAMEAELGITLFTRSRGSGATPTAEGQVIIQKANEVLMKLHELREEAQSFSNELSGRLKIATIPGPMHLLVDVIAKFKRENPNVKIEVYEKGPKEILHDIEHNHIDAGLIVLTENVMRKYKALSFERLLEGKIVAGVNSRSPLSLKKSVTPDQLVNQTFVLYDDEQIRDIVTDFISVYGNLDILFITNNTQAIDNAVNEGLAITLGLDYSFHGYDDNRDSNIVTVDLDLPGKEPVYYGWVSPKGKNTSHISKRFMNKLKYEL